MIIVHYGALYHPPINTYFSVLCQKNTYLDKIVLIPDTILLYTNTVLPFTLSLLLLDNSLLGILCISYTPILQKQIIKPL